jgi:hypothetical protein
MDNKELDFQDFKFTGELEHTIVEEVELQVMHAVNRYDEMMYDPHTTELNRHELHIVLAYAVVALEYMTKAGYRLPHGMPQRLVSPKDEAIPFLRRQFEHGWTPPPYEQLANVLVQFGFNYPKGEPTPIAIREHWEVIISLGFERFQINNGWIQSI